ncbi:hypothetical protein [Haploplasma modicum]|uniref:hypothetical protein n=1 Tax=Haploplasma modicum TaxID=2150 RepID=UPI00047D1543|nr:hypothetical protein [Haploplasma modicum]
MKFLKCPFYYKIIMRENKLRFKNLDRKAQMNVRKNNVIAYTMFSIYLIFIFSFIILIKYLVKIIDNLLLESLMMIGMILITVVVPLAIIVIIYNLISKYITPSATGELTLKNIQDITVPLKKYYKVSEHSIVTKCYKSSNLLFTNKDVLIFLYNGKIRIVLDFNNTIKDFGCYEFKQNDFNVSYIEDDGLKKTLLKSGDIEFILGKRANPFIRKCFISTKLACLSNK